MSIKRTIKTKHSDIFNYYKDKCITSDGCVEIEIGYDGYDKSKVNSDNSIPIVSDWGEPSCFACNAWTGVQIENGNGDLNQLWNSPDVKHELQRAHIVPDSLGGSDSPQNLFCLCERCHRDSPDTIYPKEFFKWVYQRRKDGTLKYRTYSQAVDECKKTNVNPVFINIDKTFNNKFKTMSSHGSVISESSYIASLVGGATEMQNKINQIVTSFLLAKTDVAQQNALSDMLNSLRDFGVSNDKILNAIHHLEELKPMDNN